MHARQAFPIPSQQVYLPYHEERCCEHGRTGISMGPVLIFLLCVLSSILNCWRNGSLWLTHSTCTKPCFQQTPVLVCPHLTAISGYNLAFGL